MPLSNIQSCQEDQYGRFDTLNIQICPLLIQWATAGGIEKVTERQQRIDREQTEHREANYKAPSNCQWNSRLSGPILETSKTIITKVNT